MPVTVHVELPTQDKSASRAPARRRWFGLVTSHPVWSVFVAAVVTRLLAVIALGPTREGVAVPDEAQYLELAASVASGAGAEAWFPGYGASLYDTTGTFMRPLAALTWAFGEHQLTGQLMAATFSVLTAVLTAWLALRVVRPVFALLAGLVVALLPSQIYWSSVVLRESMVWAALAALALIVAAASSAARTRLALLGAAGFAALYMLGDLRQQTAVVAAWSLVGASLLVRHRHRVLVPLGALVIAVAAPALTGLGPAGYTFVEKAVPSLGIIRANLSLGAASSIVETTPVVPSDAVQSAEPQVEGEPGEEPAPVKPTPPPGGAVVSVPGGPSFVVEDSGAGASLSALPAGVVAVSVRPFPWESARTTGVRLAQLENVVWLVLYMLAVVGVVLCRARRDVLAFPVLITMAVLLSSAMAQGNLGTAFRHRGQLLWALALLSAVGLQHLAERRRDRISCASRL